MSLSAPQDGYRAAFVGLGQMGRWMCKNLCDRGVSVTAYDGNPDALDIVKAYGAVAAPTLSSAAVDCDFLFLCLPNASIVKKVLFGQEGILEAAAKGLLVVDCGTSAHADTLCIHESVKEKGARFMDAPMSGMEARARDGTLTFMCGGDNEDFDRVSPMLKKMGKTVVHVGDVGSGQLMKMVNNCIFNANIAVLAEMLPFAASLGLRGDAVSEVISASSGQSFAATAFIPNILERNFQKGYPMESAQKDLL